MSEQYLIDSFHQLYYSRKSVTWGNTTWMGVPIQKCPLDLWIYQEIIFQMRPAWIIETGTAQGGSALYLCHLCDILNSGQVVTVDIVPPGQPPQHPRLHTLTGSSTSPDIFTSICTLVGGSGPVMVILDSDHHAEHVLEELNLYSPLVTPGSFLIVEDTNLNGHPVAADFGPGPGEAVEKFLADNPRFRINRECERFMISASIGGYLQFQD